MRIPRHVGVIPDGNRRWAQRRGLDKRFGYAHGVEPGVRAYRALRDAGVEEVSVYGFTKENVKRPAPQKDAFRSACAFIAERLADEGARVRTIGDDRSAAFVPSPRPRAGAGGPRVNLLVDYGWRWDLDGLRRGREHRTADIPPLDLVVRWGGGRRLSGFLPVQAAYADIFVVDALWPDYEDCHVAQALRWYAAQDRTMGG